jgi:ATP-dependent DNA ligase
MDIFDIKDIQPMLIKEQQTPYNDADMIYELKLDGIRCIAYLDDTVTDLRNKRGMPLIFRYPELMNINKQVNAKCILDGELVSLNFQGVPDFYQLQRRSILTDSFKIHQSSLMQPASFVAYDILYYKDKEIIDIPLMERKILLKETVTENGLIAVSRYIEEYGIELYNLADEKKLEGVVGKKKNSRYYYGKRSKDWVKFKRMANELMIIVGYCIRKPMNSLILGQYSGDKLIYTGSVCFGVKLDFLSKYQCKTIPYSPFTLSFNKKEEFVKITWIEPKIVCSIQYMPNTKDSLRQPVFKGIRDDILPIECQIKK